MENVNNRNKDINHTRITDSSDEEICENSSDRIKIKKTDMINKVEYLTDNNPELFIHITDNTEQKKKKHQIDELLYNQFISAIIQDDRVKAERILNACTQVQLNEMINHESREGITPIQYAALHGSVNSFIFLLALKVHTNVQVEGLYLIHVSLAKSIFICNQDKCLKMFNYIYDKLPEQRNYRDRLGRSYLHLVFEYDFMEAINEKKISIEDLFLEDNNGDYVINYAYIYNSGKCFWKVARDAYFLGDLYREIKNKYIQNKSGKYPLKESFLDNLFTHQNFYIIAIIVVNCSNFVNELLEDLNSLQNYYSQMEPSKSDLEKRNTTYMNQNISYIIDTIERLNSKDFNDQREMHFDFPQKLQEFTGIVFNSNCIKHIQLPDDPVEHIKRRVEMYENSDRLACLINKEDGIILNDRVFHYKGCNLEDFSTKNSDRGSGCENIIYFKSERKSTLNDILKCHDIDYITKLKDLCKTMQDSNEHNNRHNKYKNSSINSNLNCINTNPAFKIPNKHYEKLFTYQKFDNDTYINEYSYENIYNTTGCVFDAIDLVMKGTTRNAFALIRPPGHHAGYFGPVENPFMNSTGFCIVNNVAIGAAYAKYKYKNNISRIAIIDFDVHHGNGTEEIVQMLEGKEYTESAQSEKNITLTMKSKKRINWLDYDDPKNILFVSTHVYIEEDPKTFFPYTGSVETNTKKDDEIYPGGILNVPFGVKNNNPKEYRNIFKLKIVPRLYKFKPDLIFISAGFDGHENEIINQRRMQLNEFDFAYITQQIQFIANKFCKGRVVSVLEGGYNVSTGIISSFAQSAFFHTRSLNSSINMFYCNDIKFSGAKRKNENEENDIFDNLNKSKIKVRRGEKIRLEDDDEEIDLK